MMDSDQLANQYKELPLCPVNVGTKTQQEYQYMKTVPAYPWKQDGTDHTRDNQKVFIEQCERVGKVKYIGIAENQLLKSEPPITYQQWCDLHRFDHGFTNHIEDMLTKKGNNHGRY